jgi:phage N-6-adenine-methyltransferase
VNVTQPEQKPGRSKQDYATPDAFIRAVKARLGIIDFMHDFAADVTNAKAVNYFDEARDALRVSQWEAHCGSGWGWLNPPFASIGPWAKRCLQTKEAGGQIALLVPAGVGANWFRDYVDGHALVLLLNGRLAFMPDKPNWLYPKDCILALYSMSIPAGYEVWNWRKTLSAKRAA